MKRFARRWTLLALLVAGAVVWVMLLSLSFTGSGSSRSSDGATGQVTLIDKSEFPTITGYVLLQDAAGQPIAGLQAPDFKVTEDGIPVDFDFTSAGEQHVSVLLVIDSSGSMVEENKMFGAQQAASTFVDLLRPGRDSLGIVVFNDSYGTLMPMGPIRSEADKNAATAAIGQIYPYGGTFLYDAVAAGVQQLRGVRGRRVIIALTDGLSENGQYSARSVSAFAAKEGIPIYTIGLGSDADELPLKQIAQATGGAYYFAPSYADLQQLYSDLAEALQNEYQFRYTSPTAHLDGTRRSVAITISRSSGNVVASGDYSVSGVLTLNRSPLLLALLTSSLLGLLIAPSVAHRARRQLLQPATGALVPASLVSSSTAEQQVVPIPRQEQAFSAGSIGGGVSQSILPPTPLVLSYTLPLHGEHTSIGSAASNDIVLPNLATRHATIDWQAGRWVVTVQQGAVAISFSGEAASERPVHGSNALKHGSVIRFGQQRAVFTTTDGPGLTFEIPVTQPMLLGSASMCGLPVLSPGLQPQHIWLGYEGGRWFVEDLSDGATSVSFTGDPSQLRPLQKSALKSGSLLRLNDLVLRVA